ncbi:MAG TPA: hypothetical protein VL337_08260 [Acidimicrobiales bacterium]|nr:hypothetical protein [Acidimicrobiales bacterium]
MRRRRGPAVVARVSILVLAVACSGGRTAAAPAAPTTATPDTQAPQAGSGYGPPTLLGRIDDPAIDESSGLVASRRNPGRLWTHNDSGDDPVVYCLDGQARTCGVWKVTGADAFDWEDIAAGPGPTPGEPYLYVGDIGDNIDQRSQIVVYRIPEPTVGGGGAVGTKAAPTPTATAEALRLRYPDGARNAEALLVHPVTGDIYVMSKEAQGAGVYRATAPVDPKSVTTLAKVATLQLGAAEVVTGGDISPDGRRVALCTYSRGYELQVPAGAASFDAVWSQAPATVDLGFRLQGESVAYRLDGRALLTTSEIYPSPLQQVERR